MRFVCGLRENKMQNPTRSLDLSVEQLDLLVAACHSKAQQLRDGIALGHDPIVLAAARTQARSYHNLAARLLREKITALQQRGVPVDSAVSVAAG
jgi:hypothetical protein